MIYDESVSGSTKGGLDTYPHVVELKDVLPKWGY
jgi:hypothetical protein